MGKLRNDYQNILSREFFDKTPKAVFAALAVSFVHNNLEINADKVQAELLREWELLHIQGIVPQKPIKVQS